MIHALDLFAGAGGLSLGFRAAGIAPAGAVELDRDAAATYAAHAPGAAVLAADIRDADLARFRGIDVVCGGPPCQPFSSGGARAAQRDERDMLPEFMRALDELRPTAFVLENVPGLTVGTRYLYFQSILVRCADLGYHAEWRILNAADFGVPQSRRRLFVVGLRGRRFAFPAPTHGPAGARPHVTAREALPGDPLGEPNRSGVFYAKKPDLRPSPYHGLLFNGGGRPINPDAPAPTILASAGGNKTHFFDELGLVPDYHRHLMEGGAPRSGALPGARRLTAEESALLQTFPPELRFAGTKSSQYQQIGNAVPPLLARALGEALAAQLG